MNRQTAILYVLISLVFPAALIAQKAANRIIVAQNGSGDFRSIQVAINSLPDSSDTPRLIFVKEGIYEEKIYLQKNNIILEGENREKTIITSSVARDMWRCLHNDDWGVATVNVDANDISFKNITIINRYAKDHPADHIMICPLDTVNRQKTIRPDGHQMALRTMNATRISAIHCRFSSYAGDTVSPWNVESGLFYFKDCIMEGGVDFYCPRGWAWAEGCQFIAHRGDAAIWHDGSKFKDSKTVLFNCSFEGYDGFKLGRYHRDAQFYLIRCSFAANMADIPIYRVPTNNLIQWGERIYYYDCHRQGGNDFRWYGNNLPADINENDITVSWVFGKQWNPTIN